MHSNFQTFQMHRCHANYYCGVCFGLEHNFGQLSRLLLSNDVSLLAIFMRCHDDPLRERYLCYGKCKEKHCRFHGGQWNRLAAINLLLVREKLKDDRNDEQSWKAALGMALLGGRIRKAEAQFPEMACQIARGYEEMYRLETAGSGVRPIEECFADMMVNTMTQFRPLEQWEERYIRCIARWVYYIDALDDYEEDFQAGRFNSLKKEDAPTRYDYVKKYIGVIAADLHYIYQDFNELLEMMPDSTPEDALLRTLICHDIPLRTARILNGQKLTKFKIGSIWEGSDRNT